jgi:predicted nuclease of predicted toxin-antitoxin system
MKLLVDMNLSPRWVAELRSAGVESIHWRDIGPANATDREVLGWCASHDCVLFTHDLDFGAILAGSEAQGPSVVQLRAENVLPEVWIAQVLDTLRQVERELVQGALVTIEPARHRIRLLPLSPK